MLLLLAFLSGLFIGWLIGWYKYQYLEEKRALKALGQFFAMMEDEGSLPDKNVKVKAFRIERIKVGDEDGEDRTTKDDSSRE